jgi:ParB family transcriptional regulator, chromosome partitioning protein
VIKKSPKNVRKTQHPKADIEALAASIVAKGPLQNLVVESERNPEGKETEPARCLLDTDHNAFELSPAANVTRSAMHPADEFEAFAKLHTEEGMAADDIAARVGVTATFFDIPRFAPDAHHL